MIPTAFSCSDRFQCALVYSTYLFHASITKREPAQGFRHNMKAKFFVFVAPLASFVAGSPLSPSAALSRRADIPDAKLKILSFKSTGNACPEGDYSLQYAQDDPYNPNISGLTVSYDAPFYLFMTDEDRAAYAQKGRVERFCRHEVQLEYPVGCLETRFNITTNGIFLHDIPAEVDGFINRQFELDTGTWAEKPRPSQDLHRDASWGLEGQLWTLQDTVKDELMVLGRPGQVSVVNFAVNLTLAMWSDNMAALAQSYMRVDDTSMFFIMRDFSADCWGTMDDEV